MIVVVTKGRYASWPEIRDSALPPTLRTQLPRPPIWLDVSPMRERMLRDPNNPRLWGELTERLQQLLMTFHPGQTWESLQGEERQHRRNALRLAIGVVSVVLVLAGVAFAQWRRSELQTSLTALATSQKLAYGSRSVGSADPSLAMLLAIEAVNSAATFEARNALYSAAQARPRVSAYLDPKGVSNVAYSPDGLRIAALSKDTGAVEIWDAVTFRPVSSFTTTVSDAETKEPVSITWSPDGKTIVCLGRAGLELLSADTGKSIAKQADVFDWPHDDRPSFSPDGALVAAAGTLWDARTLEKRDDVLGDRGSLLFSPRGDVIAAVRSEPKRQTWFWNIKTGKWNDVPIDDAGIMEFNGDGDRLIIADAKDASISIWNVATRVRVAKPLKLSLKGVRFLKRLRNGEIVAWDGSHVEAVDLNGAAKDIPIDMTDGSATSSHDLDYVTRGASDISSDGEHLVAVVGNDQLAVSRVSYDAPPAIGRLYGDDRVSGGCPSSC